MIYRLYFLFFYIFISCASPVKQEENNTNNSNIKLYEHALENIFDIYLFRQWQEDNIYEWSMADFNNNDINHFSLAHLNYEISN